MEITGSEAGPGDHLVRLNKQLQRTSHHLGDIEEDIGSSAHPRPREEVHVSKELLDLQEQIVQSTVEIHGWNDKRSAAAVINFALLLRRAKSSRALEMYHSALECCSSVHGRTHPTTVWGRGHVGK